MRVGDKRCMVCNCDETMDIDGAKLARMLGSDEVPEIATQLCRRQLDQFKDTLAIGDPFLVACEQEATVFSEIAGEQQDRVRFIDIRDRAGWSNDKADAGAKIAALLAAAAVEKPPVSGLELQSDGRCLIIGNGQGAVDAATRLASRLDVTVLLESAEDIVLPHRRDVGFLVGRPKSAGGYLGAFRLCAAGVAPINPSSRDTMLVDERQSELELDTDILVDLSGGTALFSAHEKRDGYLRADPRDPLAVERVLFDATDLIGEFEKPRYINFTADICAHSRSKQIGCTRCLDVCPTGAITPDGDHVAIDPYVCAGCGSCAALCPTGAATYAAPSPNVLIEELRILLTTFRRAGGKRPIILAYERLHGDPMIAMWARHGDGLAANVLPWRMDTVTQLGLDAVLAAAAYGAARIVILAPRAKATELAGLEAVVEQSNAVLSGLGYGQGHVRQLVEDDPEIAFSDIANEVADFQVAGDFLPLGGKRERMRLALDHLHENAPVPCETIALPAGAVMGSVTVDISGCTLCLACVGACPTGALIDNPDKPMLRFLEDACIQCGLCQTTCPERVITLEPRVSFAAAAKSPRTLNEEEPFECIRCGKPFGAKSTIERIVGQLALKHSMFQSAEQAERLKMCEDCRVAVQFEAKDNPFTGGPKPRTRTTDDYLKEREEIEAARRRHQEGGDS